MLTAHSTINLPLTLANKEQMLPNVLDLLLMMRGQNTVKDLLVNSFVPMNKQGKTDYFRQLKYLVPPLNFGK